MKYYVYILTSKIRTGWSYVGQTDNVARRYREHERGKVRSTKGMRPLQLVYTDECNTREDSLKREEYLKSGFGREEKQNLISHSGIV